MNTYLIFAFFQAVVSGSVTMDSGSAAGATISLASTGAAIISTTVDEGGRFSITAPAGIYELRIEKKEGKTTRMMRIPAIQLEDGANEINLSWPRAGSDTERESRMKANYTKGTEDLGAGRYDAAIEDFKAIIADDTAQASAWASLALAYVGKKDYDQALRAGMMAIRFAPESSAYRNNLGSTLFRMGNYEQAAKRYEEAASLNPAGKGLYLSNAAAAHFAMGHTQMAIDMYKQAVADPNAPVSSWFYLGTLQQSSGMNSDAIASFRKYLEAAPNGGFAGQARSRISALGGVPAG